MLFCPFLPRRSPSNLIDHQYPLIPSWLLGLPGLLSSSSYELFGDRCPPEPHRPRHRAGAAFHCRCSLGAFYALVCPRRREPLPAGSSVAVQCRRFGDRCDRRGLQLRWRHRKRGRGGEHPRSRASTHTVGPAWRAFASISYPGVVAEWMPREFRLGESLA